MNIWRTMMNTHWERRDSKIKKRRDFKSDNRKSVRLLQRIMLKKAEVKNGNTERNVG